MMPDFALETARCPVVAHIGAADTTMSQERIEVFRTAQPKIPINMYPGAQHGFDNPSRPDRYDPKACQLARLRTLDFLAQHVG
jgi:carboxymethylenebutenolidase